MFQEKIGFVSQKLLEFDCNGPPFAKSLAGGNPLAAHPTSYEGAQRPLFSPVSEMQFF